MKKVMIAIIVLVTLFIGLEENVYAEIHPEVRETQCISIVESIGYNSEWEAYEVDVRIIRRNDDAQAVLTFDTYRDAMIYAYNLETGLLELMHKSYLDLCVACQNSIERRFAE